MVQQNTFTLFVSIVLIAVIAVGAIPIEYTTDDCPRNCGEEYSPVCAIRPSDGDMKVYTNECSWAVDNCKKIPDDVYELSDDNKCPQFGEWIDEDWRGYH